MVIRVRVYIVRVCIRVGVGVNGLGVTVSLNADDESSCWREINRRCGAARWNVVHFPPGHFSPFLEITVVDVCPVHDSNPNITPKPNHDGNCVLNKSNTNPKH